MGSNLSIYNAIAYTDGRYVTFTGAPPPIEDTGGPLFEDISGSLLPGISRWAISLGGEAVRLARRAKLFAEHGDRPLPAFVDVRQRPPLPSRRVARVHGDAERLELLARAAAELVVGERGEEEARAAEIDELDGRDRPTAGGLLPRLERGHDLAGRGRVVDAGELHPLDMADDGNLHDLTS